MLLYTPPKIQTHIPLVDLAGSFSADAADRMGVAHEIHKAARATGFFYVANHGVEPALVERAFAETARFFDLPVERKLDLQISPEEQRHGYDRLGGQILDRGSPCDLKESFIFVDDPSPKQWPADLPGFREGLLAYYRAMRGLGQRLMRLLALSLDLPEDFFEESFRSANPSMRLHRYPPHPTNAAPNQLGAGAHTDWGAISLLAQDGNRGLEVENAAGEWLRADPIPGTFVINLGDLVARWTNDFYHSNMHRVLNNESGRNRHSIVLFYSPAFQTHVECLPTCLAVTGPPKYPPCTAGEHVKERRLAAMGL